MLIYWVVSQNLRQLRNSTKNFMAGINNRVKANPRPITNPGVFIGAQLPRGFFIRLGVSIKHRHQTPAPSTDSL
ncbi:hypothetical protein NG798_20860 [Ancylothrix sp. C2]|uniref:hypothetical protein n=1 Tax=Ancylothrix sp. D3o TaxID=2953691 RepID=UPI0021BB21AC|nr:hypothetical protein [Ancylothrix sp. D3o]MCT7952251.1 hypothetical protein [Ancylothrix sp. D3o]